MGCTSLHNEGLKLRIVIVFAKDDVEEICWVQMGIVGFGVLDNSWEEEDSVR